MAAAQLAVPQVGRGQEDGAGEDGHPVLAGQAAEQFLVVPRRAPGLGAQQCFFQVLALEEEAAEQGGVAEGQQPAGFGEGACLVEVMLFVAQQ
ncbi:hypothetical protein D3C81_1827040 [compost metagenome]